MKKEASKDDMLLKALRAHMDSDRETWKNLLEGENSILQRMSLVQFDFELLMDPETELLYRGGLRSGIFDFWYMMRLERLKETIEGKEGPERQEAFRAAEEKEAEEQKKRLLNSSYAKAEEAITQRSTVLNGDDPTVRNARKLFLFYYFATQTDLMPSASRGNISRNRLEKMLTIYKRFETVFADAQKAQPVTDEVLQALFFDFIEAENEIVHYKPIQKIATTTARLPNLFFSKRSPLRRFEEDLKKVPFERLNRISCEKKTSKEEVTLYVAYHVNSALLEDKKISDDFSEYDALLLAVLDSLYDGGNTAVSFSKIFHEMGDKGQPNSRQLTKIRDSLVKLSSTIIRINDEEIRNAWQLQPRGNDTYKEIISPIIPLRIESRNIVTTGQVTSGTVEILGASPFFTLAKEMGQYTSWDKDIFRLYSGRRTKRYYAVFLYLLNTIGWLRNGGRSPKITFDDLYKHVGETTDRGKQLAREMMFTVLDEAFVRGGYVKQYEKETKPAPGIVLTLNSKPAQKRPKTRKK